MLILFFLSAAMIIFGVAIRIPKPLRSITMSSAGGAMGLGLLSAFAQSLSLPLALNAFTVITALVLGLPGVVGLVALNLL